MRITQGAEFLRIGISLVLLWFGANQLFNTSAWLGWAPAWAYNLPISVSSVIIANGMLEVFLGTLLILGIFTRLSALILGVHLVVIVLNIGYNDIAVRDFGLAIATFAVYLNGPDSLSIDRIIKKKLSSKTLKILYPFDPEEEPMV